MQEAKVKGVDDGYVRFVNLFKLSDLEQALLPYKNTKQYDAVIRYYFACIGLLDSPRLLQPLALFKQALGELSKRRVRREVEKEPAQSPDKETPPTLLQISDRVGLFESRLHYSVEQMKIPATEVPAILHFVWLGGGVGDIQRDYINLWKQVLAGQGYKINLWYDSDALLAYQTNRLIVEAAKAHAMQHGGVDSASEEQLGEMYEARAIVLKQQMFAHIDEALASGTSADEARVQLLSRAYGQQAPDLHALKERNLQSLRTLAGGDLQLRDLAGAAQPLPLQAIYDREMRLRGNLAAASDVVRAEALDSEGGMYSDVDNLPPLLKVVGGVDMSVLKGDAHRGILQLLLDHNPHWMPGRQALRSRYSDYASSIPQEHRAALEAFAKSRPTLNQVFQVPADRLARPYMLRAVAEGNSLSNAYLMAHAGSGMLQTVKQRFRFNYELIDAVARAAASKGVAPEDFESMNALALEALEKRLGPLGELSDTDEIAMHQLAVAVAGYYSDGIRPESEGTIYLTGPAAMRQGMGDYERSHFTPRGAQASREESAIEPLGTVNRSSEEELDHSWKENAADLQKWVENEKQRWHEGQYKTRYAGDIGELLKHSTVEFELGWPVIEGRHVLQTDLLQRMADGLGKRFTEAMMNGHDGPLVFEDRLPLNFDDRQAIGKQDIKLRPPKSLSNEQTRNLPIDEVLIRLASGSMQLDHLSPLQRLTLGALLGAGSLDSVSMTTLSTDMDNLANNIKEHGTSGRYAVIERLLYQRRTPAFMAGLASRGDEFPAQSASALGLKKTALSEASTQFAWGQLMARIQHVATVEHREQVQERTEQIVDLIEASGFGQVPQDLLMHRPGDAAAGRCYPLALVMSAALSQGDAAIRQLRERFYLAVLDPAQSDSGTFLNALEQLRGVQIGESGEVIGRGDLAKVVSTLEQSTGTRTLMVNSDNHSMLVARTLRGGTVKYHFYDPNFGLFEFDGPAVFRTALEQFFQEAGMAKYYVAYGEPERPMFDLIDVQGEKVADLNLMPGFKVANLLEADALPGLPLERVRQRLNSAHGRSLVENPQLGSSLMQLDNHWWAQQIAQTTAQLQEGHESVTPLVPLFDSLEMTLEGTYRLSMINPKNAEQVVTVVSRDSRLLRIKNYLSELFSTLARKRPQTGAPVDPTEVAGVHTLNAGFAVQALMNALRGREGEGRTLTTAVRWHAYVNYAQLVHGNAVDVAGLIGLVRNALSEEKVIARTCAPVVGEALAPLTGKTIGTVAGHVANEGVGAVLGLANVGFDIYQLTTAQNDVEEAEFGTQLGFDSASLLLSGAGLGAALAGAGTAAAVMGGAGVILGGLAIGAAALARAYAIIAEEAKAVGLFFDEQEQAHRGEGYRYDGSQGAWLPQTSLIIQSIDLSTGKLLLDSTKLYPLRDHFGVPDYDVDYSRAINISHELGFASEMNFAPPPRQLIVLPCTPPTCYRYEYQALPFASQRHDKGFDIARRLEKKKPDGQWLFLFSFYSFPSHYIVYRMYPDYRPIEISVTLDARERTLAVPVVPKPWHDKISYRIRGAGSACWLALNPGVSCVLDSPVRQTNRWVLSATWAKETDLRFGAAGEFFVGGVKLTFSGQGRHEVFLRIADGSMFEVDIGASHHLLIVEASGSSEKGGQLLQDHLQDLAKAHRLALRYTPVHNYLVPFEDPEAPRYTTGWYDAREDRILYIRNENEWVDDAVLSAVIGGSAFFHDPKGFDIWQVDAVTGLLSHRYRLLLKYKGDSTIRSVEADDHGVIHVMQEYVAEDGTVERFSYLIHDGKLLLSSVTHDLKPQFEALFDNSVPLTDWAKVMGDFHMRPQLEGKSESSVVDWQFAPYVSVCWKIAEPVRDMAWVRTRDNLVVRPEPRRHHERGWADSIQNLSDLMLLTMADDSDVFVVYDRHWQKLCRLECSRAEGKLSWSRRWVQPENLKQVTAVEGGYLALTTDGLFFNITQGGDVRLGGLDEQWITTRAQWWLALASIARQYEADQFAIVGVRNATGDARLSAWYVDNRLLLSEVGAGQEVRLLGVTPDNQSVWLFDLSSAEIWRQPFIAAQTLDQAFGSAAQLLSVDLLPKAQREWAPWRFSDAWIDGVGLRAITRDGIVLELRFQEPVVITGVSGDWVTAHSNHLIEHLQSLLETEAHRPFVSVGSTSGSLQWFIAHSARLISVAAATVPEDFELLGSRQYADVLLHERREGVVQIYPGTRQLGPFDYIQREGEVLVVEGEMDTDDLMPLIPDDVHTLVLRMGQGSVKCHLSQAVTRKLDSVIVDCRFPLGEVPAVMGRLLWSLDEPQKLELGIVQDHLVLVDPDSEHCLILRDVCSTDPALRGDVILDVKGLRRWPVSKLVQWLQGRKGETDSMTLKALIDQSAVNEKAGVAG
ncbi:toxin [Pseudomonas frederiksbergensis]|uniref:TcdA/TcdB pore-forming domain-containing protein n=1 Tax=Pseudomonas frederiksbergensis TaxID=104087 RepID=UPI001980F7DB|nr:TcdA/TcdB pore-forming domain-containing protein [Pseudomonas frederiksbergensis]MBN3861808.1 toxin [Pseudomonas frederiksbergensis]